MRNILTTSKYLYTLSVRTYPARYVKRARLFIFAKQIFELKGFFASKGMMNYLELNPDVIEKLCRTYITSDCKISSRVALIKEHYEIALSKLKLSSIEGLLIKRRTQIASISNDIFITLGYEGRFKREGAWTLSLYKKDMLIYSLVFSFRRIEDKDSILIGCIQGMDNKIYSNSKDAIRETTKELYGLRPADLMIQAIFNVANILSINNIYAINSKSHAYHGMVHKKCVVKFDYDNFWIERKAQPINDKFFLLLWPQRKTPQEIESKKRSMYNKRYAMLDKIQEHMASYFGGNILQKPP